MTTAFDDHMPVIWDFLNLFVISLFLNVHFEFMLFI
uniref:Uncharacterized protein n=2 Tax=Anguilla anguilla TaxID=7936 RepID=A0A0E9SIR8_ANGAN